MRLLSVVGARPNFMKLAPLDRAVRGASGLEHVIVHTGQHYDREMSDTFFSDLDLPAPRHNLGVGSGSHTQQTATIMLRLEQVIEQERPDTIIAYGDVNSTLAAALVAAKLGIRLAHVEAGLRSGDPSMPEEINRVLTDRVSDLLFTPSPDADDNLLREGVPAVRIHRVGNIMIDSLVHARSWAAATRATERHGLRPGGYVVVTLHRPSNVDDPGILAGLMRALREISREWPVIFPVHPRTGSRLAAAGFTPGAGNDLRLTDPVGYLEMLHLVERAGLVITDSGGLQEETTFLGVPCLTVRPNTERPITLSHGTNRLVASTESALVEAAAQARREGRRSCSIALWDGQTAERIVGVLQAAG